MALSGGRRRGALVALWVLPTLVLLIITWSVYARYRIEVGPRLDATARSAIVAELRSIISTGEGGDWPDAAQRALPNRGPVVVALWHQGRPVARIAAQGDTTADALEVIAAQLRDHEGLAALDATALAEARIKVDITVGRAPVLGEDAVLAGMWRTVFGVDLLPLLALHPGLEGIGVVIDGERHVVLIADELVRSRLLTAQTPMKQVPELSIGVDVDAIDATLARSAGLSLDDFLSSQRDYYRLRSDSFVEQPREQRQQAPIALTRGLPPRPELSAANLRAAAIAGGRYLVAHLAANGRYIYEADLTTGKASDPNVKGPYSIPRHAGTTYFLAELYRHTSEEFLREPIERAFLHLKELIDGGGCVGTTPRGAPFACVVDKGQAVANLGSTALTVVALAEYQRATGDDRYEPLAKRLAEWILFMQRPDGSFAHLYEIRQAKKNEDLQLLYFSGEAALAMARMYLVVGDKRYIDAARRALDDLIGWYDFFVGGFIFGQEHWLCISAEAVWPALKNDRYRAFCDGYAGFLRQQQIRPGDFPDQEDLVGAYGVTPFVMPFNTPAGSQSEAMISSYLLGKYHNQPSPAIRDQVLSAMHYLLGQQIRAESSWDVARDSAIGAMPANPIDRNVRIDFVQHTCSALIRSVELIETAPR